MNYRKIWRDAFGPIPKDEDGRSYDIHHIDGNKNNNDLSNLMCVSIKEHYEIHYKQKDWMAAHAISSRMKLSNEDRLDINKKAAENRKGKKLSEVTKEKISNALKGRKCAEETKQKISKIHKGKKISEETKQKMSNAMKGRTLKPLSKEHKQKLSESLKGKKKAYF